MYEKIVIGTVMMEPEAYLEASHLKVSDFTPTLRPIWAAIQHLYEQGALSREILMASLDLDTIGDENTRGLEFVQSLYSFATMGDAYNHAVDKVMDEGVRQELITYIPHALALARSGRPSKEVIDEVADKLFSFRRLSASELTFIGNYLPNFNEKMVRLRAGEKVKGWHPRVNAINEIVGGVADSDFIIVAGYGGGGKSSLLRYDAMQTALEGDYVLTFNGENDMEWYLRYGIAYLTTVEDGPRLDTERLKRPNKLSEEEWEQYMKCSEKLQSMPWIVKPLDTRSMEFTARQAHRKYGLSLIQVDQIQNMTMTDFEKLESATYQLRNLAISVGVPVQAAHQLRKKAKGFGKDAEAMNERMRYKQPTMDDLLYAGEHAAKQIWTVAPTKPMNPAAYPENLDDRGNLLPEDEWGALEMQVGVAKNSSGKTGRTPTLIWRRGYNRFETYHNQRAAKNKTTTDKIISTYPRAISKSDQLKDARKEAR
ncbi:MAG TPA: DnaB-like helicase C-terminal domain-containing protein [Bellilinea sp.]|nr:DnaB-like helicase C-terminal domain-containing protein [Bellilinea sp.]